MTATTTTPPSIETSRAEGSSGQPAARPTTPDIGDLVHLETMFEEYGYEDGYRDGLVQGKDEGRALGQQQGFNLGREVGFYLGACEMWRDILLRERGADASLAAADGEHLVAGDEGDSSKRVVETAEGGGGGGEGVSTRPLKLLESTVALARAFPTTNDADADLLGAVERLRGKFKAVAAVLRVPEQRYPPEWGESEGGGRGRGSGAVAPALTSEMGAAGAAGTDGGSEVEGGARRQPVVARRRRVEVEVGDGYEDGGSDRGGAVGPAAAVVPLDVAAKFKEKLSF
ncbi:hypothetical protein DFJ73DRAFT_774281 [Zopfochytrium polystomum]|nr:hypothetical protein DFJ73DRAFT_774281 [Zopfochytrium polystomum]